MASVPSLRDALAGTPSSEHERMLRGQMRSTIMELSEALHEASAQEQNRTRAAVLLAAALAAAELAAPAPPGRDH